MVVGFLQFGFELYYHASLEMAGEVEAALLSAVHQKYVEASVVPAGQTSHQGSVQHNKVL